MECPLVHMELEGRVVVPNLEANAFMSEDPKLDSDKLPRTALIQCTFGLICIRHFGYLAPPGGGVRD